MHDPKRMNPNDFADPLIIRLEPPEGQSINLPCEILNPEHLPNVSTQIICRNPCSSNYVSYSLIWLSVFSSGIIIISKLQSASNFG